MIPGIRAHLIFLRKDTAGTQNQAQRKRDRMYVFHR
jgi:hypothetical protein